MVENHYKGKSLSPKVRKSRRKGFDEEQRDIFVFQCNVGCRVGDLMSYTKR